MQEVLAYLAQNKFFFLATTENDQPRVRPIGFVMEFEGKLAFSTANTKHLFKEITANPKVEICSGGAEGKWVRICGKAVVNSTLAAKQKALEVMPALSGMYSVDDNIFEIFYLTDAVATFQNMQGETKVVKL